MAQVSDAPSSDLRGSSHFEEASQTKPQSQWQTLVTQKMTRHWFKYRVMSLSPQTNESDIDWLAPLSNLSILTRGGGPSVNSVWGLRHTLCHRRCRAESRPPRPSTLGSSWCSRTHTPCSLARGKTACSVQSRQLYSSQEEQFICSLPSPDTQLKYSQARLLHFRGHRSTSISQHNETSGIQ